MRKTPLTIQMRLLIIVGVLNILIAALISNGIYQSWLNFKQAQQLKLGSIITDDLYDTNKNLSLERASTLAILYTPVETTDFLYQDFIQNRENTDKSIKDILRHFKKSKNNFSAQTTSIEEKYRTLVDQRAIVDAALTDPITQRELTIAAQHFEASSSLIIEIQQLVISSSNTLYTIDAAINQQIIFKHFVWELAEYIGREYAIISQIIAENKHPTPDQKKQLVSLRGHIEYGWEILRNTSTNNELTKKLLPYIEEANTHYFFTFEQINELFNERGLPDQIAHYPIGVEMWLGMSEQVVDSLLALQNEILKETRIHVDTMQKKAQQKILFSILIFISTLALSIYCWRIIVLRITRPIDTMINTLYKATQNQALEMPSSQHHHDEIGKLMHVLEVFKNNAYKIKLSNEELERFAFIAAHDLKTPLRAVDTISEWLEEDLNNLIPEKSKAHINELRSRIRLMDKLLDDTLEYARIEAKFKGNTHEMISGETLIKEIITSLKPPQGFTITSGKPLAQVNFTKFPLQQILYNLIDNAITHHHGDQGMISVDLDETDTAYVFYVRDDGPGIDAKYHHKIFEMFQTLQTRDKSKGRGMGLAIVRKIITTYGGSITLESEPGKGACFAFTWPKSKNIQAGALNPDIRSEYA